MTERLHFHFSLSCMGEGNGNLLQCSCLENPRDGGAWWAAVSGVAQSQTQLKRLRSSSSSMSIESTMPSNHLILCRSLLLLLSVFANKGPSSQGYGFSSSHVWMHCCCCC